MLATGILDNGEFSAGEVLAYLRSMIVHKQSLDSGVPASQLLGPGASRQERQAACVNFAIWAGERDSHYWTQAEVARYLNDCGQLTLRGRAWSQASVNFAIGRARVARGGGRAA